MKLYLVRHGSARPGSPDAERALDAEGRAEVERVARWAGIHRVAVARIVHSELRRARETAEILALHLEPPAGTAARPGLAPDDPVEPAADDVRWGEEHAMIVGHMPFLGRLVSLLVAGDHDRLPYRFRTGEIVCLRRVDGRFEVAWSLPPELAVPGAPAPPSDA